jgi:hypothetical protein
MFSPNCKCCFKSAWISYNSTSIHIKEETITNRRTKEYIYSSLVKRNTAEKKQHLSPSSQAEETDFILVSTDDKNSQDNDCNSASYFFVILMSQVYENNSNKSKFGLGGN